MFLTCHSKYLFVYINYELKKILYSYSIYPKSWLIRELKEEGQVGGVKYGRRIGIRNEIRNTKPQK